MARKSKRYKEISPKIDREREYDLAEAITLLKSTASAKFDETVELAMQLGIDPRKSDQALRGTFSLPNGTGKELSVVVFAQGPAAEAAKNAGAAEVGGEELVEKVAQGWADFDVAIATPDMMQHVRKLGRVLGPRGKMPSPKSGTVTEDVETAVNEFRLGKLEYRNDSTGNIHVPVGKASFSEEDLKENAQAFIDHIIRSKPVGVKGRYLKRVCLTTTMGPSVKVAV